MDDQSEQFTFVEKNLRCETDVVAEQRSAPPHLSWKLLEQTSGKTTDIHVQFLAELRAQYPEFIVTGVPTDNVDLLEFAQDGRAKAVLEPYGELPVNMSLILDAPRQHGPSEEASVTEVRSFAKYDLEWENAYYKVYTVRLRPYFNMQYILARPEGQEHPQLSPSSASTERLLRAAWDWMVSDQELVWVYQWVRGWKASKSLWSQVEKTTWSSVILPAPMKKNLTHVANRFFDSRDIYKANGVPWKRGLIFHGPAGNGKTLSLKAFMHALVADRDPEDRVPCLYVMDAFSTFDLGQVFKFARAMAPCLLVFEDVETIVNSGTRSFFLNEVDGLENNDGILMLATTNYLDQLDPGLSKRPSRFDRKYLFPEPSLELRVQYCQYWHGKIKESPAVEFPKHLCRPIARITDNFSFAYMQEAFVGTLLTLARGDDDDEGAQAAAEASKDCSDGRDDDGDGKGDPEEYEFFRIIKAHVKVLREDMDSSAAPGVCKYPPQEDRLLDAEKRSLLDVHAKARGEVFANRPPLPAAASEEWFSPLPTLGPFTPRLHPCEYSPSLSLFKHKSARFHGMREKGPK
ncbi:hypothetical protein PG990_003091 [Apiospora arundinis]